MSSTLTRSDARPRLLLAWVLALALICVVVLWWVNRQHRATYHEVGGVSVFVDENFYTIDTDIPAVLRHGRIEVDDGGCLGLREQHGEGYGKVQSILWPHGTVVDTDSSGEPLLTMGGVRYAIGDQIGFGFRNAIAQQDLPAEAARCSSSRLGLLDGPVPSGR